MPLTRQQIDKELEPILTVRPDGRMQETVTKKYLDFVLARMRKPLADLFYKDGGEETDWAQITGRPTTIAGYGLTDAQPKDADLTAFAALGATAGFIKKTGANSYTIDTTTYLSGTTGVTAGTYGSSSAIPVITADAYGRLTLVSTAAITPPTQYNNVPAIGRYINPLVAIGGWSGAQTVTLDTIYAVPYYIGRSCTIDRLAGLLRSHAGLSASVKFLVYSNDDTTNLPKDLILNSGAITTTSTSFSMMAATVSLSLTAGNVYWFALVGNANLGFINSNNSYVFNVCSLLGSNTSAMAETYIYTNTAGNHASPPSSLSGASWTYAGNTNTPSLSQFRIGTLS